MSGLPRQLSHQRSLQALPQFHLCTCKKGGGERGRLLLSWRSATRSRLPKTVARLACTPHIGLTRKQTTWAKRPRRSLQQESQHNCRRWTVRLRQCIAGACLKSAIGTVVGRLVRSLATIQLKYANRTRDHDLKRRWSLPSTRGGQTTAQAPAPSLRNLIRSTACSKQTLAVLQVNVRARRISLRECPVTSRARGWW